MITTGLYITFGAPAALNLRNITGYSWYGAFISALTSKSPYRVVESYATPITVLKNSARGYENSAT